MPARSESDWRSFIPQRQRVSAHGPQNKGGRRSGHCAAWSRRNCGSALRGHLAAARAQKSSNLCALGRQGAILMPAVEKIRIGLGRGEMRTRAGRRACLAVRAAGPHSTRLSPYSRAGVARSVAMELVGHKTESVYQRYDIVAERDLLRQYKSTLPGWVSAKRNWSGLEDESSNGNGNVVR